MTSTRSSRNERTHSPFRRVFWWQMKHNRALSLFYSGVMLLGVPLVTLCAVLTNIDFYTDTSNWVGMNAQQVMQLFGDVVAQSYKFGFFIGFVPVGIAFVFGYCINAFGYMHNRRSVDLFHAAPIRRRPLLMGSYLAGIAIILLSPAAGVGLSQAICDAYGLGGELAPAFFWQSYGYYVLLLSACFAFTVFFLTVSGTLVDAVISIAAAAIGWPTLCWMCDVTFEAVLPGYVSVLPEELYTALCPYGALWRVFRRGAFSGYGLPNASSHTFPVSIAFLVWWVCFTLLLLLLTVLCYSRRKSECAEDHFAFPAVRAVIRFLLSLAAGLVTASVFGSVFTSNRIYLLSFVIGAFAAHMIFQVVCVRGFYRFWKTLPAYLLALAVSGGFFFCLYQGGLGYVMRVPDPAQVKKVEFSLPEISGDGSRESYLFQFTNLTLMSEKDGSYYDNIYPKFTKTEDIAAVCALHRALLDQYPGPYLPCSHEKEPKNYFDYYFNVTYTLADGSTLKRRYELPITQENTEILAATSAIQRRDTVQEFALLPLLSSEYVSSLSVYTADGKTDYSAENYRLTDAEKKQVWDTFLRELNSDSFTCLPEMRSYFRGEEESSEAVETYTITIDSIPLRELPARQQELIRQEAAANGTELEENQTVVSISSCQVPKCCVKTRQLIYDFTKEYGETYENEESEDYYEWKKEAVVDSAGIETF